MQLPYLTHEFPGVGGSIKGRPEDFFVQEIPLYEPSGEGEHVYAEIQKVGLTTFAAIDRLARAHNVNPRDIGYAGLKDARAITRQIVSIPRVTEEAVMTTPIEGIEIRWAQRHVNKLRLGHLAGNRFAIKLRDVEPTDVLKLRPMLDILQRRGVPNFFGEQRFGMRGDNHVLGACLIRGRPEELLHHLLGRPDADVDAGDVFDARRKFDEGNLELSLDRWPRKCGLERRTLSRLIKTQKPGEAVRSIDEKIRRLWVSALQSHLFNEVLTRRIETIDRLIPGDFAMKLENGACFQVTDPATEQPRVDAWEISPTGPIVGYRMSLPQDQALEIEQAVLKENGLSPGHFKQEGRDQAKGTRRPLRVQVKDLDFAAGVDDFGSHITIAFTLPAGSFATILLRELMKNDQQTATDAPADSDDETAVQSAEPA